MKFQALIEKFINLFLELFSLLSLLIESTVKFDPLLFILGIICLLLSTTLNALF